MGLRLGRITCEVDVGCGCDFSGFVWMFVLLLRVGGCDVAVVCCLIVWIDAEIVL